MDKAQFDKREEIIAAQVDPELLEVIDERVYEDPDVADSIARVREARKAGREEDAAVEANRDTIARVKLRLLEASGVTVEFDEEDEAERERKEEVQKVHASLTGEETDEEVLRKFHLLDDEGRISETSIHSPLFKQHTAMAFSAYIQAVRSHMSMVEYMREFRGGTTGNADAAAADEIRKRAHDTVSQELASDLNIDFDSARRMVAKMRDGVMPNSGENAVYRASAIRMGQKLDEKYGGRTAELMKDRTRIIFSEND